MILKQILSLINDTTHALSEPNSEHCCVCDAELKTGGVKFNKLLTKSTFNLNQQFKNMRSDMICSHCAVFFGRESWQAYCDRNNQDPHFPKVGEKKQSVANWFFFSHYFAKGEHRIVKKRQDWREYLCNPPKPPFCFVLSTMCKKHLIFKAEMAYSQTNYPIRFEEKIIYINVVDFKTCLDAFEELYNQGLSKASIKTGEYNSSALLKVDRAILHENDSLMQKYRLNNPDYLEICEFIGAKTCTTT
ncbi:MAG: hypothetical protein DRQ62_09295 [Gammaproteobacteria bacterium]|nr:MAG: hypothetical protein DRQ62_09295 [Gammaproteobacteria bacterium]